MVGAVAVFVFFPCVDRRPFYFHRLILFGIVFRMNNVCTGQPSHLRLVGAWSTVKRENSGQVSWLYLLVK